LALDSQDSCYDDPAVLHSLRNATSGLIAAARRAGSQAASTPIEIASVAAPTNANGAWTLMPAIELRRRPLAIQAAGKPIANPASTTKSDSQRINVCTLRDDTPSAERMPISRARRTTVID
jgi:hypothetical protein